MEHFKFKNGLLNKCVDATYIIYLEKNEHYNNIQKQLDEYHPTDNIYILFRKSLDIVDAFLKIYKHAEKKNYNNILILEDDFIFSKKIKYVEHINNINDIINKLDDTDFIYLLGCIPYLQIPYDFNNFMVLSSDTYAAIYSKQNRINTLNQNRMEITNESIFNNQNINKIMYYIPLCYQLFTETEDSKNSIFMYYISKIIREIIKLFNLYKSVEPGTTIIYLITRTLSITILLLFLIIFNIFYINYIYRI